MAHIGKASQWCRLSYSTGSKKISVLGNIPAEEINAWFLIHKFYGQFIQRILVDQHYKMTFKVWMVNMHKADL